MARYIIIIIIVWLVLEWTLTSHLHAEGSLVENTPAEMSPVARQANAGKLGS